MSQIYWVTDRLGFSGHQNLYDVPQLIQEHVGAIINTTQRPDPNWPAGIQYLSDPAKDDGRPKPASWYGRGIVFARRNMVIGRRVLIHCESGVHRSPAIVYAILRSMGHSPQDSVTMIHRARPEANPFRYQISAEDAIRELGYEHAG